jgi:ADP-ribose pyrophosphatase YjhB (NUDIX family)
MEKELLKMARRLQSIAQAGLHYSENSFDTQRYNEIRELSVRLASVITDTEVGTVRDLFTYENGFQTPKVDIRAVVLKEGKILLSRERSDGRFSIPGGFADINYSPSQVAVKEVMEETGLNVSVNRLLAIIDTDRHNFPPLEFHYYKIVILCDLIDGELRDNEETTDAGFFDFNFLPELSTQRNTPELFELIGRQIAEGTTFLD